MSALPTRCRNTAWRTVSATSSAAMTGFGMRANFENSSTMRLMSSTWRTIVSVHCSNTARSSVMTLPYLRRSRSAESWIGVSGFLISWAMRRAMSAQAEVRCAATSSVMSSSVIDVAVLGVRRLLGRDPHRQIALAALPADRHLALHQPLRARLGIGEDFLDFRQDFHQRTARRHRPRRDRSGARPSG